MDLIRKVVEFLKKAGRIGYGVAYGVTDERRKALYAKILSAAGFEQVRPGSTRWVPSPALLSGKKSLEDDGWENEDWELLFTKAIHSGPRPPMRHRRPPTPGVRTPRLAGGKIEHAYDIPTGDSWFSVCPHGPGGGCLPRKSLLEGGQ